MIYTLSASADAIRAEGNQRAQFWALVGRSEYEHDFTGPREMLFDGWRAEKMAVEKYFVEQHRQEDELLKWVSGKGDSDEDKARTAGKVIDFKDAGGRTVHGKLLLMANGGELAEGLKAFLMDDPAMPLRFYMDFSTVDTAEKCNSVFEAIRECERYFRKARGGYATMTAGSAYLTFDAPFLPRKSATTAPERGGIMGNATDEKSAGKCWKIEQDGPGITIRVTHPDGKAHMAVMLPEYWRTGIEATQADIDEAKRLVKAFKAEKSFILDTNPAIVPGLYEVYREYYADVNVYNEPWKYRAAYTEIRKHRGAEEPAEEEIDIKAINAKAAALAKATSPAKSIRRTH